jgi:arylsulfatase A-like enzyme
LFEGGTRVPGIISWPAKVPASQVITEPFVAMDIFPTLLKAAGGDPNMYELDGVDILGALADGEATPHEWLFWEQGEQTSVRHGPWKLVLNGQLEEELPPEEPVFLADLDADPAESRNLAEQHPEIVEELRDAAERWRANIEERWVRDWLPNIPDYETHVFPPGVSR